jgi:polyphosphate kinase
MNELKLAKLENTLPKLNRELSWLAFNERVLYEALDSHVPVIERLRFLGIYSNNLDEFFRVRVGTLQRLMGTKAMTSLGYNPRKIVTQIYQKLKEDEKIFDSAFNDIKRELKQVGIEFISDQTISQENKDWCNQYFLKQIRGGISPLLFREDLRFPILKDKSIYLAIKLELTDGKIVFSLIEVPTDFFPRFVVIPSQEQNLHQVILLEDIIRLNLVQIYKVFNIKSAEAFTIKLTRDAELTLDSDFSKKDMNYLSQRLSQRKKGAPVRFIADSDIPKDLLHFLTVKNKINKQNIVLSGRYHNFKDFMHFPNFGIPNLIYPAIESVRNPKFDGNKTILETIEKRDVALIYPYHSFDYLLDFLRESSIHPEVTEIKISLYRLANKSQIVNILTNAVKNGKKVTVVMEVTARFDEANNIFWSNQMKEEGIRIIYGHPEFKVHCKLAYVLKGNKNNSIEFANISTGNYNEVTADIYSDISLFTSDKRLTNDVAEVFRFLEGKQKPEFKNLLVAPFHLREAIIAKIEREIKQAKRGKKTQIIIKSNSLVDDEIIDKLYEAQKAGVKVKLIIRGICCLAIGQDPQNEIEAISIVDKYLEHARVYYFYNNGKHECFISSADIMLRNLDFRLEVAAPIFDESIILKILKFLKIQLSDNTKARYHNEYMSNPHKSDLNSKKMRSQDEIYAWLAEGGKI